MGKRKSPASAQQVRKVFANHKSQMSQFTGKRVRTYVEPGNTGNCVSQEPIERLQQINGQSLREPFPFGGYPV